MADAAVTFMLDSVKELVLYHRKLINNSKNEFDQLVTELDVMKGFLEDAAKRYGKGEVQKKLEKRVRQVVHEVEDTIDCLVMKAAVKGKKLFSGGQVGLAEKVKSLREVTIKPVFEQIRNDYNSITPKGESDQDADNYVLQAPKLRKDKIVGFRDEVEKIVNYLIEKTDKLDVISITGMPGQGKTTLAGMIHRDPRIIHEFPVVIWIYVSRKFNTKELFLNIIKEFTKQDMSKKEEGELVNIAQGYLEGVKFLLFLDDIWETADWDEIKGALPEKNVLGKVIITSRYKIVGNYVNTTREPHILRFLTDDESWELLQLEVFDKLRKCPQRLEQIGRDIADKCGRVPLAVVVVGGILRKRYFPGAGGDITTQNEWEKVAKDVSAYLIDGDKEKQTEKFIIVSYNNLPYSLRDCFLYMAVFPPGQRIPAWKLTRLWIAEGLVKKRDTSDSMEETAAENLKELINRNLVMAEKLKPDGEIQECRVHDMIREFCKREAGFKDGLNLFQEVKSLGERVFDPPIDEINKYRRLSIHSNVTEYLSMCKSASNIRSLLCFSKDPIDLEIEHLHKIPNTFDLLRVLDVIPIKFPNFPSKITNLFYLRYIALSGENFKGLPKGISELWNVQTIIVDTSSSTLEANADISTMKQLRHFKTKASIILKKAGGGEHGQNLQTLDRLSPDSCTEKVFNKSPNLKVLGIRGQLATLVDSKCLTKLILLEKLKLINDASRKPMLGLPQFPLHLRSLRLSATRLDWTLMSTLQTIKALQVLKLKDSAFVGTEWHAEGGRFHSLQFLHIERTDLKFWTSSGDPFPVLSCLVIKNCEQLKEVPVGLAKSLQKLEMECVSKSAVDSAWKIHSAVALDREMQRREAENQPEGEQVSIRAELKLGIAPADQLLSQAR